MNEDVPYRFIPLNTWPLVVELFVGGLGGVILLEDVSLRGQVLVILKLSNIPSSFSLLLVCGPR